MDSVKQAYSFVLSWQMPSGFFTVSYYASSPLLSLFQNCEFLEPTAEALFFSFLFIPAPTFVQNCVLLNKQQHLQQQQQQQ
jgi:hypothetical protein